MDHDQTSLVCRFCGVFACFGQIVSVASARLQLTRASSTIAARAIATSDAAAAPREKAVGPVLDITQYLRPIDHGMLINEGH
jgi:hypothetical protein